MPHTDTELLTHLIFSTKDRRPDLDAELRPRAFAYPGGVVRFLRPYGAGGNDVWAHGRGPMADAMG